MLSKIGVITKPQALKGEFRVNIYDEAAFTNLQKVVINQHEYDVERVVLRPKFAILKLKGLDHINMIEKFRGLDIFADVKEIKLKKGEYLQGDLIGKQVVGNHGKVYGVLQEINNYGSADIFTVNGEKAQLSFPYARNVIIKVDDNIVVDENIINEIGVF